VNATPFTLSVAVSVAVALAGAGAGAGTAGASSDSRPTAPSTMPVATHAVPDPARDHGALGLPADQGLKLRSSLTDRDGTTYVRYDRTWNGLKVLGGDVLVDLGARGAVAGVTYNNRKSIAPATATATISAATALAAGTQESLARPAGESSSVTKVVYAESGTPRLAYDVLTTGTKPDQTPTRLHTIVDAATGKVITSYDEIETGVGNSVYSGTVDIGTLLKAGTYQLKDTIGNYTTDLKGARSGSGLLFTDLDDTWGTGAQDLTTPAGRQSAGVDAQYGAEKTYEFYSTVLGRAGVWNDGTGARSRVHFGDQYANAFWDGTQMTYGDGYLNARPLTELDVAAHEMTHGVTENTANLTYEGESGGINEATSDIFGTAVEFFADNPTDPGDYLIGEQVNLYGNDRPLRYMDRPSRDGYSPDCWSPTLKNLNVHYSSGPLNHWFYLASEGSGAKTINGVSYNSPTCNGSTVVGVGRDVAEKVWYRTLTTKLTSSSDYAAARNGAIASARELYGALSIQCSRVAAAFSAIGVAPGTQTCASGPVVANAVANGGFESGGTGWTASSGAITNSSSRPAHSGSWKAWLGGKGRRSTDYVQQSVAVPSTGTPSLSLWVRIDTGETTSTRAYDTMKVQVLSGSTSTLATYSNLSATGAYVQKTFDLSAYKGKTVTVRFLAREDRSRQTSFVIDDVAVAG
jgi:Zn-dependent metalloprotease